MSGLQSYPTLTSDDPSDLMAAINQIARIRQQDIGISNNSNTNISNIGTTGCVACSATGTNAIALTQNANQQVISAYNNYQQFSFVAVHTSTGNVTVNINAIGALNLYLPDGVTQAASGNILLAALYTIAYNSALNSNAGGFQIISSGVVNVSNATGTLAVANGGTGDTGTAWTAYTPTVTAGSGTFTTVVGSGRYKTLGKTCWISIQVKITTNGTAATAVNATLPLASVAGALDYQMLSGRENASTGKTINGYIVSTTVSMTFYDGTYPGANGYELNIQGAYETA